MKSISHSGLNRLSPCLAILLALTACSNSPSVKDAEALIRGKIESESGGHIKMVSFKKTGGQAVEALGVKGYGMSYEAEIEFDADGTWLVGQPYVSYRFSTAPAPKGSWTDFTHSIERGINVHHGHHAKIAGVVAAQKQEDGWNLQTSESHVVWEPSGHGIPKSYSSPQQPDDRARVMRVLQLLNATKWNWCLQTKGAGKTPSEKDIEPYLDHAVFDNGFPKHPAGGTYVLNPAGQKPESTIYGFAPDVVVDEHDKSPFAGAIQIGEMARKSEGELSGLH